MDNPLCMDPKSFVFMAHQKMHNQNTKTVDDFYHQNSILTKGIILCQFP